MKVQFMYIAAINIQYLLRIVIYSRPDPCLEGKIWKTGVEKIIDTCEIVMLTVKLAHTITCTEYLFIYFSMSLC